MTITIGALGTRVRATLDDAGRVAPVGATNVVDWWIGGDDRWRRFQDGARRQSRLGAAPVVETRLRIPSGDARQTVWAVGDDGGHVVIEVENDSPAPCIVAPVIEPSGRGRIRSISVTDHVVRVDGAPVLVLPQLPYRVAGGSLTDAELLATVAEGRAGDGPFQIAPARHDEARAAVLFAVPHRGRVRFAVPFGTPTRNLARLPDATAALRGWAAQLDRGMRVTLPDSELQRATDSARAELLLREPSDPFVVRALEDWGFDAEAAVGFELLSRRDRRVAARRDPAPRDPWAQVFSAARSDPLALLVALRHALVDDTAEGPLILLRDWPDEWRGQSLEVHAAPTRRGPVSFALRWHGEHPALIWDVAVDRPLRVPGLQPDWERDVAVGEELLR